MADKPETAEWLSTKVEGLLRRIGLKEGQNVLDFGCHKGNYALPAARIVGPAGTVYALDKEKADLDDLARSIRKEGLRNIKCLHVPETGRMPFRPRSVDVTLLYDVYHRGYSPEGKQRARVLRNIHRALKPGGLLSLYPTHLRQYGMTFAKILREVNAAGFRLRSEARRRLVHDGSLVRGRIFSFTTRRLR